MNDARMISRILRVNHAGEHGAISIYSAQLRLAPSMFPELEGWLVETLGHETDHRTRFQNAMPQRGAKPCRALFVWSIGGQMLGWVTSLFGATGVMVCTAAVERTVHRHLADQIAYLSMRDAPLAQIVNDVKIDEDAHLAFAEESHNSQGLGAKALSAIVGVTTECLIWLSTRGDSMGMTADLKRRQ